MADAAAPAQGITAGLEKVTGFFDGVGRVADSVAGIVDTGADMAEDVARGRNAIHEEQQRQEANDLNMWLRREEFKRGDNRLKIFAFAAGAVVLLAIMMR